METCLSASVEAYAGFLKRLTWSALHDPGRTDAFAQARYLYLEDEEGTIDTLAIGAADDRGHYLRLHTTGHVFTITPARAATPLPHSLRPPRHAPPTLALSPSRAVLGPLAHALPQPCCATSGRSSSATPLGVA